MSQIVTYIHGYILCLLRPRAALDWLQHGVAPYAQGETELPRPEITSQVALSWAMAIIQGIARLMLANMMVQLFLYFQNENDFFYALVDTEDGLFPYYLLLFSTAIDLIFFPILTLVVTEFWNFLLRLYAMFLGIEGDRAELARDITTVALSSNFFLVVPVIGVVFQQLAWLYLLYVGCRHRMGASRALSIVILITPTVFLLMGISMVVLGIFYLIAA